MSLRFGFLKDRSGATVVEFGLLAPFVMVLLIGIVELSVFVWQWNSAQRAVRTGARLASMSVPVSDEIAAMTAPSVDGSAISSYTVSCDGSTMTCSSGGYNASAMDRLLTGGDGICEAQTKVHLRGLCDIIPGLTAANVQVSYESSINEVTGAPGGIQPVITVTLRNVGLGYTPLATFGGTLVSLPDTSATTLGQDLSEGDWS